MDKEDFYWRQTQSKQKTMRSYRSSSAHSSMGCIFISFWFVFAIGIVTALSFWTDRNLDFWLSVLKEKPVDVPLWLSALLTIALNAITLLLNIIGELARLLM